MNKLGGAFTVAFFAFFLSFCGEGNGTPPQYSCLENPMDGGAWWAAVHGVTKSWTRLSNFIFTFHFPALEKEMATHSSLLAWRILGTGEPGGLPSMGSHKVGHDWSNLAAAAAAKFLVLSALQSWRLFKKELTDHRLYVLFPFQNRATLFLLKKKKKVVTLTSTQNL